MSETLKPNMIEMHSGRVVDPLRLTVEDIDINDIAYHLAGIFRYNGGSRLTVAQHCALGAEYILNKWQGLPSDRYGTLGFLLHDAPEAYLQDLARPRWVGIQRIFPEFIVWYRDLHASYFKMILLKFAPEFSWETNNPSFFTFINNVDNQILCDEERELFGHTGKWGEYEPLGIEIKPWSPEWAEKRYLQLFGELTR